MDKALCDFDKVVELYSKIEKLEREKKHYVDKSFQLADKLQELETTDLETIKCAECDGMFQTDITYVNHGLRCPYCGDWI